VRTKFDIYVFIINDSCQLCGLCE